MKAKSPPSLEVGVHFYNIGLQLSGDVMTVLIYL